MLSVISQTLASITASPEPPPPSLSKQAPLKEDPAFQLKAS